MMEMMMCHTTLQKIARRWRARTRRRLVMTRAATTRRTNMPPYPLIIFFV
jgi:hypothetical protein